MKLISRILLSIFLLAVNSTAQEGVGFLNFVNLIPADKACEIKINSKDPAKGGLKSGDYTGWFLFPTGQCSLVVKVEGLKEFKAKLEIKEGIGALVAIYIEPDPKQSEDDEPSPPLLKIKGFPTYESNGLELRFASVCAEDNRFEIGPLKLDVDRFEVIDIPSWNGAGFELKKNGKKVKKVSSMREKEAFYLLAGSDTEGNCTAALVFGGTPGVPDHLKKKKP